MRKNLVFDDFRGWKVGPRRREAVRDYIARYPGIIARVAARAAVHRSVVSKILHGRAVSAPVEGALGREEKYAKVA